jgi:hypothetical protein
MVTDSAYSFEEETMSQTPQDPQPLEQEADRKQYHAPEFRDYGTLQDRTQTSVSGIQTDSVADGVGGYVTGGVN